MGSTVHVRRGGKAHTWKPTSCLVEGCMVTEGLAVEVFAVGKPLLLAHVTTSRGHS